MTTEGKLTMTDIPAAYVAAAAFKELPWRGGASRAINVDHLDGDRLNNAPTNLVVSCLDCNTKRGAR